MTTSSSSVPVLGPVLYFTQTDGYSYDVDNRPLFHLDTNIRHINTSLVGIGYGEHASLSGGALSPGTAVALAPNGSVFYPIAAPSTANPTENIVGLVIGVTDTGLNRVIWSSKHLDLDVVGLSGVISGASGAYLYTTNGALGVISATTTPNLATQFIVGRIKSGPYIEVNTAADIISSSVATTVGNAAKDNHANLYGVTRMRNLLLLLDAGEAPVQFSKTTKRIGDYYSAHAVRNPLNAILAADNSSIATGGTDSTTYTTLLDDKVLKESYTQLTRTNSTSDIVEVNAVASTWPSLAYGTELPYTNNASENYELQKLGTDGPNYNNNLTLFKAFTVDKYYQYMRADSTAYGNLAAVATIFNPQSELNPYQGGEASRIVVWDFFEYNIAGYETVKRRVVLTGSAADEVVDPANSIFPATLITY